jgi:hypothetical protein
MCPGALVRISLLILAVDARALSAQTKRNPKDGLIYVWIPRGTLAMGCSPGAFVLCRLRGSETTHLGGGLLVAMN